MPRLTIPLILVVTVFAVGCTNDSSQPSYSRLLAVNLSPMIDARARHSATQLTETTTLFVGGAGGACDTEIYTLRRQSSLIQDGAECRMGHSATMLQDQSILIAGGISGLKASSETLSSAEVFLPSTRSFTQTGSLATPRFGHQAIMLGDGTVLITGGYVEDKLGKRSSTPTAELYNPQNRTFVSISNMNVARVGHTATLLSDGSVLLLGGTASDLSAEIFQSATKQFRPVEGANFVISDHTATTLNDERILILGGVDENGRTLADAVLFDPETEVFSVTGTMRVARAGHTATLLPDGRVLITGGNGVDRWALSSVEVYEPESGQFSLVSPMSRRRVNHTATVINASGDVLLAGGWGPLRISGPVLIRDVELITTRGARK